MATCSIVRTFNSARSQLRVLVHSLAIQNTANPISDSDNGAKTCPSNAHNSLRTNFQLTCQNL